jgi:ubiquinone/menaquinone biosynthesis C-methylase UbiE
MSNRDEITQNAYDQNAAQIAEGFWQFELTETWDAFTQRLAQGVRIADIGCGPGRDTAQFVQRGFRVAGLDYSFGMLGEAQRRAPAPYLQGDMRILPFASNSFKGAWVCASLLHLPRGEAPRVMAETHRILKPGGVLYISLKEGQGEEWDTRKGARFFTYYQADEVKSLLESAGFEITELKVNPGESHPWINIFAQKPA